MTDFDFVVGDSAITEYYAAKRRLGFALISRVITDQEMAQVEREGPDLYVERGETYNEAEKVAEFREALLQQFKMRDIANRAALAQGAPARDPEQPATASRRTLTRDSG